MHRTQELSLPSQLQTATWRLSSYLPEMEISHKNQPPIVSAGLDKERQWYLYTNIRQYVLEPWQDVMCPLPKEQGPNSADEEMTQRPLVGVDTNLPVIVSTKALQSTGYTDCVDIEAGRGRGRGRARRTGISRGKSEIK